MFSICGTLTKCGILWDDLGRSKVLLYTCFIFNTFLRVVLLYNLRKLNLQKKQLKNIMVINFNSYIIKIGAELDERPL
jgi:hypothetical protein